MGLFDFVKKKKEKPLSIGKKANIHKSLSTEETAQTIGYEKDRYKSNQLLEMWVNADKSQKTIVVNDIEIEQYVSRFEEMVQSFWKNISEIDNKVQEFCIENYEGSNQDIKNFIVELSWVSLEEDQIKLGYWGKYVNIELRAVCKCEAEHWEISEICYQ